MKINKLSLDDQCFANTQAPMEVNKYMVAITKDIKMEPWRALPKGEVIFDNLSQATQQ